jgi:hypothetical protein
VGKFLNIVVLAVVVRRCGNSKISNYRQNFLATLLHNGIAVAGAAIYFYFKGLEKKEESWWSKLKKNLKKLMFWKKKTLK